MNKYLTTTLTLAVFSLLAAGCEVPQPVQQVGQALVAPPPTVKVTEASPTWKDAGQGVSRLEFNYTTTTPTRLVVYRLASDKYKFHFENSAEPKRISDWYAVLPNASLIVNGVYFHEDNLPSGFMVAHSQRVGTRQFDLDLSGLIDLSSGALKLINTKSEKANLKNVTEGAQSYPFLILDGKSAVTEESGKMGRRTFVGLDREQSAYVGVVPDEPITLRELSLALKTLNIDWDRVINLDGGPSTGLKFNAETYNELEDSYTIVPNVLVVEKK